MDATLNKEDGKQETRSLKTEQNKYTKDQNPLPFQASERQFGAAGVATLAGALAAIEQHEGFAKGRRATPLARFDNFDKVNLPANSREKIFENEARKRSTGIRHHV